MNMHMAGTFKISQGVERKETLVTEKATSTYTRKLQVFEESSWEALLPSLDLHKKSLT